MALFVFKTRLETPLPIQLKHGKHMSNPEAAQPFGWLHSANGFSLIKTAFHRNWKQDVYKPPWKPGLCLQCSWLHSTSLQFLDCPVYLHYSADTRLLLYMILHSYQWFLTSELPLQPIHPPPLSPHSVQMTAAVVKFCCQRVEEANTSCMDAVEASLWESSLFQESDSTPMSCRDLGLSPHHLLQAT